MRIISNALFAIIFLSLVLSLFAGRSKSFETGVSPVYPVHDLNTGLNYTTINEAIVANETLSGDTIFVEKGVYSESLVVGKQLHLVGEDREATVIDGEEANQVLWLFSGTTVTNFTIRHGLYGIRACDHISLLPHYGGNSIINNTIEYALYAGIILEKASNVTIMNNFVANNVLSGIHIWSSANDTIIDNTMMNNGHGIDFYGYCRDNILKNNTMRDNAYNFGAIWYGDTMEWFLDSNDMINEVDSSNTVNGKPIYYWINKSDEIVPLDAGCVWLIDCNNITVKNLDLSNNIEGIMLVGTKNALIDSNNITRNAYGILLSTFSYNNALIKNTLEDNDNGVYLGDLSSNTTMRDNAISGGQYNFGISSWTPSYDLFSNAGLDDIDFSNTVDGKPIVWFIDQHHMKVPSNAGYVMLINCTDITVEGLSLSYNMQSIILVNSNNTFISNNSISNSVYGISIRNINALTGDSWFVQPSVNNTMKGNTILNNGVGCRVEQGDCTILNNTLTGNPIGIALSNVSDSTIAGNIVEGSKLEVNYPPPDVSVFLHPLQVWQLDSDLAYGNFGAILFDGNFNMIYDNTVEDSFGGIIAGYRTYASQNNIVCHNNFMSNTVQAFEAISFSNYWDFGYPTGGNYWNDYAGVDTQSGQYQNETGSDGIGDTPISHFRTIDNYPLIDPYTDRYDIAMVYPIVTTAFFRHGLEMINISIDVVNLSVEAETLNVTLQANSTTIVTFQNVSLPVGKSSTITYEWDLTGVPYGKYLITVSATPVPKESHISDNTRSLLVVHTIPGDLNYDGMVGYDDAAILSDQFGSEKNQRTQISGADINGDGEVDILDAIILSNNFARTW